MSGTEATISWDVSGYYMYLPATFIYKDLKQQHFQNEILQKYRFTPDFQQAFLDQKSGNYVMKYSSGQALQYLPFFAAGHLAAKVLGYPDDGFSLPYQLAISIGALLVSFLGLFYLRKVLLNYFSDGTTALVLLVIVLATNYLNYAAIDGAMTHNLVFTLYALLLYFTDRFYRNPTFLKAAAIGICCGWATLTRPTEIISVIIPLLWGIYNLPSLQNRFRFIASHLPKFLLAALLFILVGSIQMMYWKYATGNFLVYSYQDQTFSWLAPHFKKGIFSHQSGWLFYTPVMVFSLIGFIWLYKQQRTIFPAIFVFSLLFIYICFAWDIWWYGGSLGIRAMVQAYAVLAFPLAAFTQFVKNSNWKFPVLALVLLFTAYNLWLTHQAHRGGLLEAGNMTKAYFWRIVGKNKDTVPKDVRKFLDTDEEFTGVRKDVAVLLSNDFEQDTTLHCSQVISGKRSLCLTKEKQYSPEFRAPIKNGDADYVRATAEIRVLNKEWDVWKMAQFIIKIYNQDQFVKQEFIRVHRIMDDNQTRTLYVETKLPKEPFDNVRVSFWNADSDKELIIDNLVLEKFNE